MPENIRALWGHLITVGVIKLDQIMYCHTNVYPYKHLSRLVEGVFNT